MEWWERISRLAEAPYIQAVAFEYEEAHGRCRRTSLKVVLEGVNARSRLLAEQEPVHVLSIVGFLKVAV